MLTEPKQKLLGPSSERVGTRVMVKSSALGLLPSARYTATLVCVWCISSWTGPPESGNWVRLLLGLSKPPQGPPVALSSSNPRLSGQVRRKCAEVSGSAARNVRALKSILELAMGAAGTAVRTRRSTNKARKVIRAHSAGRSWAWTLLIVCQSSPCRVHSDHAPRVALALASSHCELV